MIDLGNLRTENYILRKLKNSDKEKNELFSILNTPDVKKYVPGLYVSNIVELEHFYIIAGQDNIIVLSIEDIEYGTIVGIIFIRMYTKKDADISYIINKDKKGQGIIPMVLKILIKHLYDNRLLTEICFRISTSNKSSIRVMQKLNIPLFLDKDDNAFFNLSLTEELPF